MVTFVMYSEVQVTMLKTKVALNEIPIKSRNSSHKIWPSLVYGNDTEELHTNDQTNSSGQRDVDSCVRIYYINLIKYLLSQN